MQKVLRRSLLARNQALRKSRVTDKKALQKEEREYRRDVVMRDKALRGNVKAERTARREDWFLGPLAPQRDVGDQKGVYGTLSPLAIHRAKVPERHRDKYINFAVGDRVAVVRGTARGKIAEIRTIDTEAVTVVLEGINTIDQELPEYARRKGDKPRPIHQSADSPVPIADVRLVIPMRDEETDEVKDVVVRHLRGGEPMVEQQYGVSTPRHTRYIEGLDIEIPWPEAAPTNYKPEESDTLRLLVEQETYLPHVAPPFEESVMDELRNPFSLERSRHKQEFIDKKLKEDAFEAWKKSRRLLTPQAEHLEKEAKKKREARPAEVTDDLLQLVKREQLRTLGGRQQLDAS